MFDNRILIPVRISFWRGAGNSVKMRPPIDSCMPWQRLRICDTQRERRLGSIRLPSAGGRIECNLASRSDVCVRGTDDMWGPRNQPNCGAFIGHEEKGAKRQWRSANLFPNQTGAIYKNTCYTEEHDPRGTIRRRRRPLERRSVPCRRDYRPRRVP